MRDTSLREPQDPASQLPEARAPSLQKVGRMASQVPHLCRVRPKRKSPPSLFGLPSLGSPRRERDLERLICSQFRLSETLLQSFQALLQTLAGSQLRLHECLLGVCQALLERTQTETETFGKPSERSSEAFEGPES